MLDALEEAFEHPYGGFSFRRKGEVEDIRDTGSRRLAIQVEFAGSSWQTLQLEVARPEAAEVELVPVAISIADFRLDGPSRVACLSLRFQIAQKLHAVTERPEDRENLRFWDLIDLILLRELLDEGGLGAVREACVTTFAIRGTHAWPPELVVPESGHVVGSAGGAWAARLCEPTGLVSSRRHIEPCMRFSRTRLSDVLHRRHSAIPAPRPVGARRDDGSVEVDQAQAVRRLVGNDRPAVVPAALVTLGHEAEQGARARRA